MFLQWQHLKKNWIKWYAFNIFRSGLVRKKQPKKTKTNWTSAILNALFFKSEYFHTPYNRQNSLQMLNAWVVPCRQEWKKLHRIVISFLKENEICKCQIFKWGSWLFLWLKICACDGNEISMFTVTWEFLMCVYIYTLVPMHLLIWGKYITILSDPH